MKAVIQPSATSHVLEEKTLPVPTPTADSYLIHVKTTSPCPGELDWEAWFAAIYPPGGLEPDNRVPGTEGAGVVAALPTSGTPTFAIGDEVFFRIDAVLPGAMKDYTLVPAINVAPKPKSLSWAEAGATALSSLTAWQGIFEHGTLDPAALALGADTETADAARKSNSTQRVLITGASGSVGNWAVQFAAAAGAHVVAVCSGAKAAAATKAGAAEVIDYTTSSVGEWAKGGNEVDLIFDAAPTKPGDTGPMAQLWSAIKDGGTLLSVVNDPNSGKPSTATPFKNHVKAQWFLVTPRGSDLARIGQLVDGRDWKPMLDSVVPWGQYTDAFTRVDEGRARGKVVITVNV
ncbi:uncharacterized protein EHS24_006279 [Apiotrichum porosum]|uniref:Enoyl reductase (ER) domain-containing protein n=1 Tax=Apiotrichum porosum TaxID=105984 RepID=A0A427Y183_9TREE|nr:uncharacterized protein EHS24_006279 [Apiotrichum porosum]RSH84755.1 hypothetical protein EHS24_006279 [Apiotrichum porosum]